ncbi:AMP-binding protein [Rhodobacter sp. Har01]|uniref:AMP-binding protein n=1 Tax=Rhodobacter sp. Har01 TaxID=2883999 RepID=UPI001D086959|nr:AMP-binding protein [Rhodobacter sp. Har01]MCB6180116.1 AMP-binding protein [Rhodobacter sp. Har01]
MFKDLSRHGDRIALVCDDGRRLTYAALAGLADGFCDQVRAALPAGVDRPLVLIETLNRPEAVAAYLGALRAGWPVVLTAEGAAAQDDRIERAFRPNYLYRPGPSGWEGRVLATDQAAMHPDLRVLLSTSGTTGAPKLVRLSDGNLRANAASIVEYLGIGPDDRAITALPFHYSYGMAVLNSHLSAGACLLLTDDSVVEDRFWAFFAAEAATSLALVPFQIDLLEKTGRLEQDHPSLNTVTQAGGRLAETAVLRMDALSRRQGWTFFVMYGQTEAAPRMAYMPPEALATHPDCMGVPIPGGRFTLLDDLGNPVTEPGRPGELVYEGPNVMLGYAEARADLAAPAGPSRLATGDMAERTADGFFRIVGRLKRFVKLFGLRISLDEVEAHLRDKGLDVYCTGSDDRLVLCLAGQTPPEAARDEVMRAYALPAHVIATLPLAEVPLLPSGKVDYRRLRDLAETVPPPERQEPADLVEVLKTALRSDRLDRDRTFAEQGGDSLSYLEVQLCLERRLGTAPPGWENLPLGALLGLAPQAAGGRSLVRSDLLLRLTALTGVIVLHATDLKVGGGVFLLVLLVGYSLARFQSANLFTGRVVPFLRTMLQPILIGYFAVLILVQLAWRPVDPAWFLLAGNFIDSAGTGLQPYWFVCLYAQVMILIALAFAITPLRRQVASVPFVAGAVAQAALMALWLALPGSQTWGLLAIRHPVPALLVIATGWTMFFAGNARRKLAVSALLALQVALVWALSPSVVVFLLGGGLLVVWTKGLHLPAWLARAVFRVGRATLFIYLAHVLVIVVAAHLGLPQMLFLPVVLAGSVVTGLIATWAFDRIGQIGNRRMAAGPVP